MRHTKFFQNGIVVGIDASRCRSGGAIAHLIGLLTEANINQYGIDQIHLWTYESLMNDIPDYPWLIKHTPHELDSRLMKQLYWQAFSLANEVKEAGCDILFTADASTLCRFKPMVVLSQDMLSYEPGVMRLFGWGVSRWRLLTILCLQNRALRFADGVIFLTQYAAQVIQRSCGPLKRVAYIPHGLGTNFKHIQPVYPWPKNGKRSIVCLYVSNAAMYKHQWMVIRAIEALRNRGYDITLTLVGGGTGPARPLIDKQLAISDPNRCFVQLVNYIPQHELPHYLANADLFVFASSCENMPNTLVEKMAVGLPIACSNRGPMPEVLRDAGVYFDPEDANSIADAIERIIQNETIRTLIAKRAQCLAEQYSWARCARETFSFIAETYWSTKQ